MTRGVNCYNDSLIILPLILLIILKERREIPAALLF